MTDIFGPGHHPSTHETTVRVSQTATGSTPDTWFAQCDANGVGGTVVDEMWLNLLIANLRRMVRTAGALQDEVSDDMLAEALARYAAGGDHAVDAGGANTYVVATPGQFKPPLCLFPGLRTRWRPANINTGASTLNAHGLGVKALLRPDGSALTGNELLADLVEAEYDPAAAGGAGGHRLMPWACNMPWRELLETTTPPTPVANRLRYYTKAVSGVSHLFAVDHSGIEIDLSAGPAIAYTELTAYTAITTPYIPLDDTIPQSSEGTQILSVAHAPKRATSRVRVVVNLFGEANSTDSIIAALFNGGSGAVRVQMSSSGGEQPRGLVLHYEYAPASIASVTWSVRVSADNGNMHVNGRSAGRLFGGAAACSLMVTELYQ